MPEIIRAQVEHWPLVREIRLRALSADPAAFCQTWDAESQYPKERWLNRVRAVAWFLALDDGEPVGVVASRREADSPEDERELQSLWVHADYRGQGTAQELANAVFEWARADGATVVTLFVDPFNTAAISLYEQLGFVDSGARWPIDSDPAHSWIKMARDL